MTDREQKGDPRVGSHPVSDGRPTAADNALIQAVIAAVRSALRKQPKCWVQVSATPMLRSTPCVFVADIDRALDEAVKLIADIPPESCSQQASDSLGRAIKQAGSIKAGQVFTLGERAVRVVGDEVVRDFRGRIAVRNVATNRLSYVPEWRLRKAEQSPAAGRVPVASQAGDDPRAGEQKQTADFHPLMTRTPDEEDL